MQLARATIAVTGATGFLGGYLVAGLRQRGARVVAVVRNREKAERLLSPDVEIREAALEEPAQLARAFIGVDAVIANAAVISFRHPRLTMRTNIEGTRNVFAAMAHVGVKRAVAISSASAYRSSRLTIDEREPLRALTGLWFTHVYGASKAEGERVAWQVAESADIALTTFRPCGITGPLDPLLMGSMERIMRAPVTPFPTHTTIGVVHAGDVAEAVARALERPQVASGKAYNLQGHTVTLWQLADAWRRAGGPAPRVRIPVPVPIALRYDDARARAELDWRPRSLESIVQEAVDVRRCGVVQERTSGEASPARSLHD